MNNIVLFIFGGLLWGVLGFGLGLVFPMFRAQRRLGAVEDAVRSRRATAQDREIEISPAMRLFVTDANGGSHVTFVEDSGAAVQVLADRAVTNLAHCERTRPSRRIRCRQHQFATRCHQTACSPE